MNREQPTQEKPIFIQDVMALTGLSESYTKKLVSEKKIPCYRPFGSNGKIYFKESDIINFVFRGRQAADYEVSERADAYLNGEAR